MFRFGSRNNETTEQAFFHCILCQCDVKSVVTLRAHCKGTYHVRKELQKKREALREQKVFFNYICVRVFMWKTIPGIWEEVPSQEEEANWGFCAGRQPHQQDGVWAPASTQPHGLLGGSNARGVGGDNRKWGSQLGQKSTWRGAKGWQFWSLVVRLFSGLYMFELLAKFRIASPQQDLVPPTTGRKQGWVICIQALMSDCLLIDIHIWEASLHQN